MTKTLNTNGTVLVDINDGFGTRVPVCDNEPLRATYGMFITGYTPAANPTDFLTITPSGSKIARIKSLVFAGAATTASNIIVNVIRRSTANTGGTSAAKIGVPRDTQNDASAMNIQLYSANPASLGTIVGTIDGGRLNLAPAANGGIDRLIYQYSWLNDQALIVRPGDFLSLNLAGAAWPAAGILDFGIMWSEE